MSRADARGGAPAPPEARLAQVEADLAKVFEWIRWLAATAQPPEVMGGTGDASDYHDGLYRIPVESYKEFGRAISAIATRRANEVKA